MFLIANLLLACDPPTTTKEAPVEDTDTGGSDGEGWDGYDPASTVCGKLTLGDCRNGPAEVEIWSLSGEGTVCSECRNDTAFMDTASRWTDWRDELVATAPMNKGGYFEATIPVGEYGVVASWSDCFACGSVEVIEGDCAGVEIEGDEIEYADAPNIYVYPKVPTAVRVRVGEKEKLMASEPPYPAQGWRVVAEPDGSLHGFPGSRLRGTWDYLFYERTVVPEQFQHESGWCVDGQTAQASIEDAMLDLGFSPPEIGDFADYWDANFPSADVITVYPQLSHLPRLDIQPAPDRTLRAWFVVEDGCARVDAPVWEAFDRTGYVATEWGVVVDSSLERVAPTPR